MKKTTEFHKKVSKNQKSKVALLIATSLILSILLVEGILRLTPLQIHQTGNISWYHYDSLLGIRIKPNLKSRNLNNDYQEEIISNSLGTINFEDDFTGFDKILFAVGDSFTQGTGLYSDASYPSQLDRLLNIRNGNYSKSIAVVNLGLASYGLLQSIEATKLYSKQIGSPDYILFLGYNNDSIDDELFKNGYRHRHVVHGSPIYPKIFIDANHWLSQKSQLFILVKTALSQVRRKFYFEKETASTSNLPLAAASEPEYRQLLTLANSLGAKLIISFADDPAQSDGSYDWVKNWARSNNVAFADWQPTAQSYLSHKKRLELYNPHSGGHFRTWVNEIIANQFAEIIISQNKRDDVKAN